MICDDLKLGDLLYCSTATIATWKYLGQEEDQGVYSVLNYNYQWEPSVRVMRVPERQSP